MVGTVSIVGAVVGFLSVFLLGFVMIPYLKKLKVGQTIREEGPKWHQSKGGTPTMGGVMMLAGLLIATVLGTLYGCITDDVFRGEILTASSRFVRVIAGLGLAVGMCIIGFFDDYIKVVKKRNLGLTARQKTFGQLIVSAVYLIVMLLFGDLTTLYIPFVSEPISIINGAGLIFWPIALFFVYGFTNAVNLNDGIDGLASSVTLVVCCAFMVIAGVTGFSGVSLLSAAGAGICIGFVMWNAHPAKVFMGDTGSMLLGGLVVGIAFAVDKPILLIPAGIVYLIEALSVMIQVAYFKKTKKRIFKMAPIHHHFEMCGWSEEKVVFIFSIISLIGGIIAILPVAFGI